MLGLQVLAVEVALGVYDGLGSPAVPLVKVIRHGSSGSSSAWGGGVGDGCSRHGTQTVGPAQPAAARTSPLRSSHTTSAGCATSRRSRRSLARSCSVQGSTT